MTNLPFIRRNFDQTFSIMADEFANQVELVKKGIDQLRPFQMTARVHCSKANSLLDALFQFRDILSNRKVQKKKGTSTKKVKKSLKTFVAGLNDMFLLMKDCANPDQLEFQNFLLRSSIKTVFDRFFTIRQAAINCLELTGFDDYVYIFQISPEMLYNQNHVDLKRLYYLMIHPSQ